MYKVYVLRTLSFWSHYRYITDNTEFDDVLDISMKQK